MDLLAACEDLAANVAAFDAADEDSHTHISDSNLSMWQTLFGFSMGQAANAIVYWRADFTRLTISQAAWLFISVLES